MSSPITPDLIYELITVGAPALSPDGSHAAFVRSKVDKESMETRSRIALMDLSSGDSAPFTAGPKDSAPRFSPDGARMAFIRPDSLGRQQLWTMPTRGGEAERLTDVPGGVTDVAWSPDSDALAFVSDVDPDRVSDEDGAQEIPRVSVARRIRYRADGLGWRGDASRHIFIANLETGETRQLTDGDGDDSAPAWSPDGKRIAFIGDRRPNRDVQPHPDLYAIPSDGGEIELLSDGLSSVAALAWSPDGSALAVVGSDDDEANAGSQSWIFTLEPNSPPRRLTDDSISPAGGYAPLVPAPEVRWADSGISFIADARGVSGIYTVSPDTRELRTAAAGGSISAVSFDAGANLAVFLRGSPQSPGDIYMIDMEDGNTTQITDCNLDFFAEHPAASMEKFTFDRGDFDIESRLLFPPGFDEDKRYPMVLDIHGGPHGVFSDSFSPQQQILATAGYIVLAVNPRGSSTYGAEFMKAVLRDWGGEGLSGHYGGGRSGKRTEVYRRIAIGNYRLQLWRFHVFMDRWTR